MQRDKHSANKGWFNPEDFIIQKVCRAGCISAFRQLAVYNWDRHVLPKTVSSSCAMDMSAPVDVTGSFMAVCSVSGPSYQETRTRSLGGLLTCLSSS